MIALVLAGGPLRPTGRVRRLASQATLVIAADGGLRHAATLGVVPELLVGDLDSVREEDLAAWPDLPRETHPRDKDELDLELAIDAARARGADVVRVVGAFGGRFDQTLATALIAARYAGEGLEVALLDGIHDAHPLTAGGRFDTPLPDGTVFSLLALGGPARVDVSGAAYPLHDATLPAGRGLGLSNRAANGPTVRIHEGRVLLIVEWEARGVTGEPTAAHPTDALWGDDAPADMVRCLMSTRSIDTRAVHAGMDPDPANGAHATPIFQTSSFAYGSFARGARLFGGEEAGYVYGRLANPTVDAFERAMADLEGGEAAVAFASGMAAIAAYAVTTLEPGDEVAYLGPLYGGTAGLFLDVMTRFGVTLHEVSEGDLRDGLSAATRLVYLESPTNPNLRLHDLRLAADAAHAVGARCAVDNTFATPVLTRPLEHGADIVLHSATKYLGGHGDVIGGVLVGAADVMAEIRAEGLRHLGGTMSPLDAFLLLRGIKTLPLRMARHCANAAAVAHAMREHPAVEAVRWPGFDDHPQRDLARRQMSDFGGMVSLELAGGRDAAERFLDRLELFTQAVSLGDVESLATHPASTTHQLVGHDLRERQGVTEGLVRLSIGIESPADLIGDLRQALE